MNELGINTEFDLTADAKPEPLCPHGVYLGNTANVSFNPEQQCIVWTVVLAENGGFLSDGATPIDGIHVYYRNWLPRQGDSKKLTKGGKNKKQTKINMLADFAQSMEINMNSPAAIQEGIQDGLWIGIPVTVEVQQEEFRGVIRNTVNRMSRTI